MKNNDEKKLLVSDERKTVPVDPWQKWRDVFSSLQQKKAYFEELHLETQVWTALVMWYIVELIIELRYSFTTFMAKVVMFTCGTLGVVGWQQVSHWIITNVPHPKLDVLFVGMLSLLSLSLYEEFDFMRLGLYDSQKPTIITITHDSFINLMEVFDLEQFLNLDFELGLHRWTMNSPSLLKMWTLSYGFIEIPQFLFIIYCFRRNSDGKIVKKSLFWSAFIILFAIFGTLYPIMPQYQLQDCEVFEGCTSIFGEYDNIHDEKANNLWRTRSSVLLFSSIITVDFFRAHINAMKWHLFSFVYIGIVWLSIIATTGQPWFIGFVFLLAAGLFKIAFRAVLTHGKGEELYIKTKPHHLCFLPSLMRACSAGFMLLVIALDCFIFLYNYDGSDSSPPNFFFHLYFHIANALFITYLVSNLIDPIPHMPENSPSFFGLRAHWKSIIESFVKLSFIFGLWCIFFSFTFVQIRDTVNFTDWWEKLREHNYVWHSVQPPESEMIIPKIIHQTYINRELPEVWKDVPAKWQEKHPDWEYRLWTDEDNRNLINNEFPWFLETYDSYLYNIQRVDSSRYFILLKYGGVYVDLDLEPVENMENFIRGHNAILPKTPNYGLTNAFMASAPNHPFFQKLVSILPSRAQLWRDFMRHLHIIAACGPFALTRLSEDFDIMQNVSIVTPQQWGKPGICGGDPDFSSSVMRHLSGESWNDASTTLSKQIFCSPGALFGLYLQVLFCLSFLYYIIAGIWSGNFCENFPYKRIMVSL